MLLTASGLVKNVVSGFGTTIKGSGVNQLNGDRAVIRGEYRYLYGTTDSGTRDPIIAGVTMNKNAGTRWVVRVDNTGQPLWIAAYAATSGGAYAPAVTDDGDFVIAAGIGGSATLYNADGTTFTPAETLNTAFMVARLGADGNWVWARRYGAAGSDNAPGSLASSGTHLVVSLVGPTSVTYDGTTYTTATSGAATLLFLDTSGTFLGHVSATSTVLVLSTAQITLTSGGVVRWHGQTQQSSGTVTLTVLGSTLSVPIRNSWLVELSRTSVAAMRLLPTTGATASLTNLADGGLAFTGVPGNLPSGPQISDYGNGVVLERNNRQHVVRFNSSLVAQVGRELSSVNTAGSQLGGIGEDGPDLVVYYRLFANDTIAGQSISAASGNLTAVVHRVTKSTLTDKWVAWAEGSLSISTSPRTPLLAVDDGGTALVYLRIAASATAGAADMVLYPGAITYARESETYELFATVSDTGVWQTP
jgi:hypothetical protein